MRRIPLIPLPKEEQDRRNPLQIEQMFNVLNDKVHKEIIIGRPAKTIQRVSKLDHNKYKEE